MSTNDGITEVLKAVWDHHSILVAVVGAYIIICFCFWLYLRVNMRDETISSLEPARRDVRPLLKSLRNWIVSIISGGGTAFAISGVVILFSLPFQHPDSGASPEIVQVVSFMPVVILAFMQLASHYRGVVEIRRYMNGEE